MGAAGPERVLAQVRYAGWLEQAFPAAQAPLGGEAGEGEEEHNGLMPKWGGPIFRDRNMLVGELRGENIQLLGCDHFSARFFRDFFEQRAIGGEGAKLVRGRVGRPSSSGVTHGCTGRVADDR